MVCAPVRRDNPRALARGLSTVQAHKPCSISCTLISSVDLAHYVVSCFKDWVSGDCSTSHVWVNTVEDLRVVVKDFHLWSQDFSLEMNE